MIKNKLLANSLCALTILSIFGSPIVHAEDEINNTTQVVPVGTAQDTKTTTLSYEVNESYEWSVHPTIDFGKNAGPNKTVNNKNNTISVTENVLRLGNKLTIKIKGSGNNGAFSITNGGSQTLDYVVNDGSKNLTSGDVVMEVPAGTNTANKSIEFTLNTTKKNAEIAGTYNGTVSYTAEIEKPPLISKNEDFTGYYADIDGNGTVDGVIFNDALIPVQGGWGDDPQAGNFSHNGISTNVKLKDYTISQESYSGKFGSKPVISPISEGEDRFYVMALENIGTNAYTWYNTAENKMNDYSSTTSGDFGTGRANTTTMISKWNAQAYGKQNAEDLWGVIQSQATNGWFVPSRAEWATFAATLSITQDNYSDFGLSDWYWSSSQGSNTSAWAIYFGLGYVRLNHIALSSCVRLATTF